MEKEIEKVEETTEEIKIGKEKEYLDFNKMLNYNLEQYVSQRDRADYINWAKLKEVLHKLGATKVYFEPITQSNGSSLIMSDREFENDKKDKKNKVYETRIKIVVDELEFEMQGPVMNGANPVQDNSMTQQRLWNAQTRLFVKGVAIHLGLGFRLWSRLESNEEENQAEDLSIHNLFKIQQRVQEIYTRKIKLGLTTGEIAQKLSKTEDEVKALFTYFNILSDFEKNLSNIKND